MLEEDIDLQLMPFVSGLLALDFARSSLRRMATSPGWPVNTASPLAVAQKERREHYQKMMMRPSLIDFVSVFTAVEVFERITSFH